MSIQTSTDNQAKEKAISRLYELLALQKKVEQEFGKDSYNVFVFRSYLNTGFVEGFTVRR